MNQFNCNGCGACCKSVPAHVLALFNLPTHPNQSGCGNLLPDNRCAIYDTRPEICNVHTMWRKSTLSWDDYCDLSKKMCEELRTNIEKVEIPTIIYPEIESLRYLIEEQKKIIEEQRQEIGNLKAHIDNLSCCCAGCEHWNKTLSWNKK